MRLTREIEKERALTETKESDLDSDPKHVLKKEIARELEQEGERARVAAVACYCCQLPGACWLLYTVYCLLSKS